MISQVKKCGDILKKLSNRKIVDDQYVSNISFQDLLYEIVKSFENISEKEISLNTDKAKKKIPIKRTPKSSINLLLKKSKVLL